METHGSITRLKNHQEIEACASVLNKSFSPSAPVNHAALFAGRTEQRQEIDSAIAQRGQHVIIFGERGVGKTSLANIILEKYSKTTLAVRVNCDSSDTFQSVWRKAFGEITLHKQQRSSAGFIPAAGQITAVPLTESLPKKLVPDEVRKTLTLLGGPLIIIIDEFDRMDRAVSSLFADTIKTLSDNSVAATIILVGVADSIDTLMAQHASAERALVQVPMPRMSDDELVQIVTSGLSAASMSIEQGALEQIIRLSQGLPHYTHLLALYAGRKANDSGRSSVTKDDVEAAIAKGVEKAQESIKSLHYKATISPRKDNLYSQVLLACALAPQDRRGFFAAADIRDPMSMIMNKVYQIPAFSQHLNDFCDAKRGPILERHGAARRYRFRFVNPLMQPYVIMFSLS